MACVVPLDLAAGLLWVLETIWRVGFSKLMLSSAGFDWFAYSNAIRYLHGLLPSMRASVHNGFLSRTEKLICSGHAHGTWTDISGVLEDYEFGNPHRENLWSEGPIR